MQTHEQPPISSATGEKLEIFESKPLLIFVAIAFASVAAIPIVISCFSSSLKINWASPLPLMVAASLLGARHFFRGAKNSKGRFLAVFHPQGVEFLQYGTRLVLWEEMREAHKTSFYKAGWMIRFWLKDESERLIPFDMASISLEDAWSYILAHAPEELIANQKQKDELQEAYKGPVL